MYQYYLENYEKVWSEWGAKTQKEYTNLKEGRYRFHVRAKNVNGEISPESIYEFYVNPPWYRSIWAYSVYGLSVIALLFTGFNLLDQKYQREQKMMALKQKKELNKKENELNKLTQQSQEEITRLQNEKLESELRHMNNELGTSTMHLLNKNEFISSIKTNLQHIIKKATHDEVKRELVQITKDIENNISADTDWEQFQYHFDRVHGDFSTRFKAAFPTLSPQEIKLSAYLRMNLSSKEIAQLLNISIRGVEISRYRLRKKLQLDRNKNLQEFILNF
jgi:DNA-binding CsgD family transcriptional regulator